MSEEKQDMLFRTAGILGLAVLLGFILWAQQAGRPSPRDVGHNHSDPAQHGHDLEGKALNESQAHNLMLSGSVKDNVRVIDYDAFQYEFNPDPLVVKAGEHVRLNVKSRDVTHGMMIPAIDFSTDMPVNERKAVEFNAPVETGEYPVFCSVFCGPGHGDMKGRLIVLPAGQEQ